MDSIHHIHGEFVGKGNEENYNIQEDIRAQLEKGIFCLEPEFSKVYFQSIFPNFVQPKFHFWPNSEFRYQRENLHLVTESQKNKYFPHSKRYSRKKNFMDKARKSRQRRIRVKFDGLSGQLLNSLDSF